MWSFAKKAARWILGILSFLMALVAGGLVVDEAVTKGDYVIYGGMVILFILLGIALIPVNPSGTQAESAQHKPKGSAQMPAGFEPVAGTGGYPEGYVPGPAPAGPAWAQPASGVASAAGDGSGEEMVIDYAAFPEEESTEAPSGAPVSGVQSSELSETASPAHPEGQAASPAQPPTSQSEAQGSAASEADQSLHSQRAARERAIHEAMSPVTNLSPDDFQARSPQASADSTTAESTSGEVVPGIADLPLSDIPQLRTAAAGGDWVNVQLVRKAVGVGKDPNLVVLLEWKPVTTIVPETPEYEALIGFAGKDGALQVREEAGALRGTLSMRS